jgi:integration host factor subunit alpha
MEISFDALDSTALTKAQLSEMLFEQIGLNKREAKDFVDAFFEKINVELAHGRDIKISGFGNFEVKSKSARPGRNPRTGKEVTIPPRRVVSLRASGQVKEQINKS